MKQIVFFFSLLFSLSATTAQAQSTCFSRLDEINTGDAYAIVTDLQGDYYIAGVISDSAKYNGALILSGRTYGYFVAKFSASHQLLWLRNVRDIGAGLALTLDGQGNIILGGYYRNKLTFGNDSLTNLNGTWDNAFIAKFRPNGNHVWSKRIQSSHPSDGRITSLAADSLGNIYFGGRFSGTLVFGQDSIRSRGSTDDFWGKMDSTSHISWVKAAGSPSTERGVKVAADKTGNLYVTGSAQPMNAYFDQLVFTSWGYIARYSPTGQLRWLVTDSSGGFEPKAITLGGNGEIAVTGTAGTGFSHNILTIGNLTVNTTVPHSAAFVIKLDTIGFVNWIKFPFNNAAHWGDDIVIKDNGNMVVSFNVNPVVAEINGLNGMTLTSCNLGANARGYGITLQGQDAILTGDYTNATSSPFYRKLFIAKFSTVNMGSVDLGVTALASPLRTGCYTASEPVKVTIKNFHPLPVDFSQNNATVTVRVIGGATATLSTVLTTGTLASNDTMQVTLSPALNMLMPGIYYFEAYTRAAADVWFQNDTLSVFRTRYPVVTASPVIDFSGYNGTNLSIVYWHWLEAHGNKPGPANASAWEARTGLGSPGNVTAALHLHDTLQRDWLIGPTLAPNPSSRLIFDAAITNAGNFNAHPTGMTGTDDKVQVMVSTDCRKTWTPVYTFDATTAVGLTNVLTRFSVPLSAYAGRQITIAFFGSGGLVNDSTSYEFHLDNIAINTLTGTKQDLARNRELKIYPNPSHGIFSLETPDDLKGECQLEVQTLIGKTVAKLGLKVTGAQQIDLKHLPKGIYLLRLSNEKAMAVKKIIIE